MLLFAILFIVLLLWALAGIYAAGATQFNRVQRWSRWALSTREFWPRNSSTGDISIVLVIALFGTAVLRRASLFEHAKALLAPDHPEHPGSRQPWFADAWHLVSASVIPAYMYMAVYWPSPRDAVWSVIPAGYFIVQYVQGVLWHEVFRREVYDDDSSWVRVYSRTRNLLLTAFAFFQTIMLFSFVYKAVALYGGVDVRWTTCLHWSVAIGLTLAYWDFADGGSATSWLVLAAAIQTVTSFIFAAVAIALVVGAIKALPEFSEEASRLDSRDHSRFFDGGELGP